MHKFSYSRASVPQEALASVGQEPKAKFVAGGTNLFDLMKEHIECPEHLTDINRLDLAKIEGFPDGSLRLGALASNAATAWHPLVEKNYPLLSQAILAGASPQLRNMATNGGNPLQRTRCYYFYDLSTPCNKRTPGTGCSALKGFNRIHAILGTSEHCIATHPSDMCVALMALDARVEVLGLKGSRTIDFADFHRLPGDTPHLDHNLEHGDLITSIDLPAQHFKNVAYLKLRDRQSYAFALVSVAAIIELEGASIKTLRLALGGVAHKPWRNKAAEAALVGKPANAAEFRLFAEHILADAIGYGHNTFKIELAKRAIVRALEMALNAKS
ncbi:xanthine dehydrogenase family protein subunit M [Pedobacter sp. MC2016-14]|uniref:FAD binding domain-containing protein n=1 Tax=Pedobacter sp. MC2016-14 TaxID=2897327 RepID=UPI001E55DCE8|nr:xanthine dehydrogenase family protein subunit M [Pedobacter sp. MC2016-14]MCD0489660.1 xanthine dehydrogenase family protein subunit M [Pedobacter sp. MC2016-14]